MNKIKKSLELPFIDEIFKKIESTTKINLNRFIDVHYLKIPEKFSFTVNITNKKLEEYDFLI